MTFLIQITVYLSVTALLILLFKRLFKDKLSAKWHVYIWSLLLIRFLLPYLPQSEISIFNAVNVTYEHQLTQKQTDYTDITQNLPVTENASVDNTAKPEISVQKNIRAQPIIFGIWKSGVAVFLLYFIATYFVSLYKSSKQQTIDDADTLALLDECAHTLGIHRSIRLISGETPMLIGGLKPKIVLPDGYSRDEKRNIIIHELCHIKNSDITIIWTAILILCLNWFNPIIWYSFFTLRRDLEVYCDERVLNYCRNKKEYATLLLKSALAKNKFVPGTTSLQNGEKEIERRIKYMAYFKKPKLIWSIAIAATATVISAICLTNAAQSKVASVNLDNFNMYKVGAPGDKDRGTVIAVNDKDFTLPHGTCPIFVNGSVITDVGAVVDDKAVYIPIEKVAYALGKKYISQYKKSELSTSKVIDGKTYLAENDLEKLFKVNVDYYNKDGDNNVNPYFAPFSHVIISGGIKKEKLTAQRATEELRSALITAFENVYGEYTPLYEKPNSVYNEMQNMRYIITTLKPKAETDRFYQFPVVYDFWVDKYTGEVYAYYNGISNWVYLFNPHDKNALSFPG